MAIDTEVETLISFGQATHRLPRRPGDFAPVSPRTVARWALRGWHGIRLDHVQRGRRQVTSVEACRRFVKALAGKAAR